MKMEIPKFKVGDWIVNRIGGIWHIKDVLKNTYDIETLYGDTLQPITTVDMDCRLLTIDDFKKYMDDLKKYMMEAEL